MEKVRDKHGMAERELRGTISECEKARSDAASLQLEVERFAARMGKYQDAEERMNEEMHRCRIETEKYKEKLDKANGEIEFLKNAPPTGLPGQEASGLWTTLSRERERSSRNRAVCENQLNESVTMAMSFKNRQF